jgi:hypothetical protein
VYKDGDIKRQVVTLRELGGVKTTMRDLERVLVDVGAVEENDMRVKRRDSEDDDEGQRQGTTSIRTGGRPRAVVDQDDDDWD